LRPPCLLTAYLSVSLVLRRPTRSTLFPYTTLFRSLLLLIQAIIMKDILFAFLAAFLLFTGLAKVPCCGAGEACSVDTKDRLMKRSEEHTSELQSRENLVCRLLLEKKNHKKATRMEA